VNLKRDFPTSYSKFLLLSFPFLCCLQQLADRDLELAFRDLELADRDLELAFRVLELAVRDLELAFRVLELAVRDHELAVRDLEYLIAEAIQVCGLKKTV